MGPWGAYTRALMVCSAVFSDSWKVVRGQLILYSSLPGDRSSGTTASPPVALTMGPWGAYTRALMVCSAVFSDSWKVVRGQLILYSLLPG
ncbi:MAG: hypothetical protein PVH22_02270, partial [Desulfobacteraceae bacterium]